MRQTALSPPVSLSPPGTSLLPPPPPALLLPVRHLTSGPCLSPSLLNQPHSLSINLAFIPTHTHTYTLTDPVQSSVSVCGHGCELRPSGLTRTPRCANVLPCGSARCVCGGLPRIWDFWIGLTDSGGRGLLLPRRTKRATAGKLRGKSRRDE